MKYFLMSEMSQLNVKWANVHVGNNGLVDYVHCNPFYELIMVTEGPVYLRVEEENLTLQTGETYLLSPWQQHQGWKRPEETSSFFWVQFTASPPLREVDSWTEIISQHNAFHLSQNILRMADDQEKTSAFMLLPQRFKPSWRFELFVAFEKLVQLFRNPEGYFRFRLALKLGELLETLACNVLEQLQLNRTFSDSFITYRQLVSYLNEHYREDLSKAAIENHVKRKYEYLCQIFKKYSGFTISQYVHELRIQSAKHWLKATDAPIAQISENVGYKDPYYFSKTFRKIVGVSPSDFRERHAVPAK